MQEGLKLPVECGRCSRLRRYEATLLDQCFVQFTLVILLALAVAKTTIGGRYLLVAALLWNRLGPSSFFLSFGKRNRMKTLLVFAFAYFYQLFIFGWLAPLGVGIYRVTRR
jgi:hypothetical protein